MRRERKRTTGLWAMLLVVVAASPATAQSSSPVTAAPRVEVNGGVTAAFGGGLFPDTGVRANLTRAIGVGATLTWVGSDGIYVIDARWAPHGFSGRAQPFVTAGAVGMFRFRSRLELRRVIETTGDTLVYAPFHDLEISGLRSGAVGGGIRMSLTKHLALETTGQVWLGRFNPSLAFIGGVRLAFAIGQVGR